MAITVEEMRAVCVAHYAERGHSPAHADMIISKDEQEIRRIYGCIQREQEEKVKLVPCGIAGLTIMETAAE